MESTTEAKLPFHTSALYKKMKAEGLIDENKEYIGEIPLAEYYEQLEQGKSGSDTEEAVKNPQVQEENKEPSIPLSQVQEMVNAAVAASMKSISVPAPAQTPQVQPQQYFKVEQDIDDIPEFRNWEMKDREYELVEGRPISCSIASKHTKEIPLQYTNKEKQSVHILRYAVNQPSFFVEKQSKEEGSVVLNEIIFYYGRLKVPAENVTLQKFLAIHPHKGITFKEYDPLAKSIKFVSDRKEKLEAGALVFKVGETMNRAIASLVFPHYVESWPLELLEEEVLAYSEKEPKKYIAYTEDKTIKMKGVIKSALAKGDLIYSNYRFLNSKREIILEVAKNQDELDEMVRYFESGVGRTFYEFLLNSQN